MDSNDLQEQLEAALAEHNGVGASAAVYRGGEVTAAAAGLANNVSGVEMTPETVLHVGSITKIFNTTLLMQLVDEGLVALDDPVSRHLPKLRLGDPDALAAITVKMLVNHTSGIDGEIVPEYGHDLETIAHAISRFADMGQIHGPGEDCSYCNTATVIAGYLCQQLTGKSWYDLVRERIFQPLGMEHAATLPEEALLHRASVGHFLDPGSGKNVRTSFAFLPLSFAPAGATLMMSAADLVTFCRAHLNGGVGPNGVRILSEAGARAMQSRTTVYKGPGFAGGFGLGWMLYDDGSMGHAGGGPGILSWLMAHPDHDFAIAVLTNVQHGMAIINEVAGPYLTELGMPVYGSELEGFDERPEVPLENPATVLGRFENCAQVFEILEHEGGYGMRIKMKFAFYDGIPTDWTPAQPVRFISQDLFLPRDRAGDLPTAYALVNADGGVPRHLAGAGRLYKRVD